MLTPTLRHLALALGCAAFAACSANGTNSLNTADSGPIDTGLVTATPDGGTALDVGVTQDTPDVPAVMRADSGCPAPMIITPQPRPGFLPPTTVRFIRAVDGDTSHFSWPVLGEIDVRFLWVNTEESHGAETTAFGTYTAQQVARILAAGREFVLMPQEQAGHPGERALDMYGRTLALVFVDGELFQTRLIREGWSAYYAQFGCAPEPMHTAFIDAEAEARAGRLGIWQPGHPTDYAQVFARWTPSRNACRPNPFRNQPYCR